jgi:putative flippase GtrA
MIKSFEKRLWGFLKVLSPKAHEILIKKRQALAFLAAGGIAVAVDASTLYLFKGVFGFNLIPAVAIAFMAGFCTSFTLQKFWTFEDSSTDTVHTQAVWYFIVAVANFFLTIVLMYLLVEVLHFWYILSKLAVAFGIALCTFFIYRAYIFKQSPNDF